MSARRTPVVALILLAGISCSETVTAPVENRVAAVQMTAPRINIRVGETLRVTAVPVDESGAIVSGASVAWISSDPKVATVDLNGNVIAVAPGTATIVATSGAASGKTTIVVTNVPISTITITPFGGPIPAGEPTKLTVIAKDSAGNVVTGRSFLFASSDEQVVRVASDGTITGGIPGTATIIASSEGRSASVQVTIAVGAAASLSIEPNTAAVYPGTTTPLTAVLRDKAGNVLSIPSIQWTTSDPSRIGISSSGVISGGSSSGTATITATSSSLSATAAARIVVIKQIGIGVSHTCMLDTEGETYCWGTNRAGETGTASLTTSPLLQPKTVVANVRFQSISVGASHTCGLTTDGAAWCWGSNLRGSIGDGTTTDRASPVAVNTNQRFVRIAAGWDHVCAQTAVGAMYCWGGVNYSPTPGLAFTVAVFDSLYAGQDASCGIKDGVASCWGSNQHGQLGTGDFIGSSTPRPLAGNLDLVQIDGYSDTTCGLTRDGKTYCWGPRGGSFSSSTPPLPAFIPQENVPYRMRASGRAHSCGIDASGVAYCSGSNEFGQLGVGPNAAQFGTSTPIETAPSGASAYSTISAGSLQSCAVSTSGVPYCWGSGELTGTGFTADRKAPTLVKAPE